MNARKLCWIPLAALFCLCFWQAGDSSTIGAIADAQQGSRQNAEQTQKVFQLKYTEAREIAAAVQDVFSRQGVIIVPVDHLNAVVCQGTDESLGEIEVLITALDVDRSEDATAVHVLRLENGQAEELLHIVQTMLANTQGARVSADQQSNSLIIAAPEEAQRRIAEVIRALDETASLGREEEVKIFPLDNMAADEAAETLMMLMSSSSGLRLIPDMRTNSLIARGNSNDLVLAAGVIDALEKASVSDALELVVYVLDNADSQMALGILQTMLAHKTGVRLASDHATGSIYVLATPRDHRLVQQFLDQIDARATAVASTTAPLTPAETSVAYESAQGDSESASYKVRIIWLHASEELAEGAVLPRDLEPVEQELSRYGIVNVALGSQLLVNTATGMIESSGSGVTPLGQNYSLSANGFIQRSGDRLQLSLSVDLGEAAGVSTEIFTTPGHYTVLGVTPAEDQTAIFVVQVLAND